MSGAIGDFVGNRGTFLVVEVEDVGGGIVGWNRLNGTINGETVFPPLRTAIIDECRGFPGASPPLFRFGVNPSVASTFIKRLIIQTSAGTALVLNASDATFEDNGSRSSWEWEDVTPWTTANPERIVEVHF